MSGKIGQPGLRAALNNKSTSCTLRLVLFFSLFQLPVMMLFLGLVDYSLRYLMLAIGSILLIAYSIIRKYSLKSLGFRSADPGKDLLLNSVFCLVLVLFLWISFRLGLIREPTIPDWNYFFVFYIFVSSPLQEFLFRSLVFRELKSAGAGKITTVAISTINFGLMHIIYHDWVTFLSGLFIGLCLGIIYSETRSLYGISASHAVVGAVSIYVGLV